MAIRVGRWDCPICKTKGNLGPDKQCANCGSARPVNVKFYMSDDAEIVKNIAKLKEARAGADWVCSYCNSHNKVSVNNCHTCGNDRQIDDGDESLKQSIHYTDGRKQSSENKKVENKEPRKKEKRKVAKPNRPGVLITLAIIFLLIASAILKSDIEVTATAFEWHRTISLEKYEKVIEDDWKIPTGGSKIESYEDVHHYDNIADGTETKTRTVDKKVGTESVKVGEKNLGNGYFEDVYEEQPIYESYEETYEETVYKKVAVYKIKYKYSIFKWVDAGELKTKGNNHEPYWSKDTLFQTPEYREKERESKYIIHLKEETGEPHKEEVSYEYWKTISIGDKLEAQELTVYGLFMGLTEK